MNIYWKNEYLNGKLQPFFIVYYDAFPESFLIHAIITFLCHKKFSFILLCIAILGLNSYYNLPVNKGLIFYKRTYSDYYFFTKVTILPTLGSYALLVVHHVSKPSYKLGFFMEYWDTS